MYEDLLDLHMLAMKSKRLRLPEIPDKYAGDFIRGYFDGDGNIWMGKIHTTRKTQTYVLQGAFTSASKKFINNLWNQLKSLGIAGEVFVR